MNICIAGAGYVGLSMAALLCKYNKVCVYEINENKVNLLNNKECPIKDELITDVIKTHKVSKEIENTLTFTNDIYLWLKTNPDFIIISTPTNYDENSNYFDTSSIENIIGTVLDIDKDFRGVFVIKSTIPIGYVRTIREKFNFNNIIFSPEFLREGQALYDNLHPSRIVIGVDNSDDTILKDKACKFAQLLQNAADVPANDIFIMGLEEAESVKLFANTYLAMRVAYFNELDNFAMTKGLNTKSIIDGICSDQRIGINYNNPSFGYGGYCLPKDTKQLLANFKDNVRESLIHAIVESNDKRKLTIAYDIISEIKNKNAKTIGVYKLAMKSGSDNCRMSAIFDIVNIIKQKNPSIKILVYDTNEMNKSTAAELGTYISDLDEFKNSSDLIITNRFGKEISDVIEKVYTRDVYNNN